MRFKPIHEFLLYVEQCHAAFASLYRRIAEQQQSDRNILLLQFMQQKERLAVEEIDKYIETADPQLLSTWLKSTFDENIPNECAQMELKPNISIEEVIALAMKLENRLINLMAQLAAQSTTSEIHEALDGLVMHEQQQQKQFIHNVNRLVDI
ncbi:hypothetical protein [Motilimonas pumila]|uniref:DUF892 family protein n=1 Tax=Motilimonas pumila TaxID=2303987 RepID=A0A418YHN3_9GAMM|nr:hypothetical protein [Motilimonas pumila]RJG49565.1 hypothetical protein D1Z90_06300 [Motilimonas pumila]